MRRDSLDSRPMTSDYARARAAMIESQIRTSDVTAPEILAAFRATPREAFTPPTLQPVCYGDMDLMIAPGRVLLSARTHAKLLQALRPAGHERALELGAGLGYGAAVLARLCKTVIAHEPDPGLSQLAHQALSAQGHGNAAVVSTEIARGWPDAAPYDVILVHGGAEIVPEAWLDQLAEGGRLAVIVRSGPAGVARIYLKAGGQVSYRTAFDAAPPVLPGLEAPRAFAF
jgi:protein-L-isoaspartate(D-aspartate) O-methyltransferase